MNTGNGQRQNHHVGRVQQQQLPGNPNLCQFQYVGMPIHHQGLKNNQFSPTQIRNHGYMGHPQPAPVQQTGQAPFPVATMANIATPVVAGTFPSADILANFNQMGAPRQHLQYKTLNNWTNPTHQSAMALPSIGSLWSHFQQQQHNKQNIQQQQPVAYLPSQPQQFINSADGLTLCGNPNLQYGMNQNAAAVNHNFNYGGFVINRLPQTGSNQQIVNASPPGIAIGQHGMIPTNIPVNSSISQSTFTSTGIAQVPLLNTDVLLTSVASSSNQVTTPTTTITLTCSTSAQVTETATVHSRIPVSSVLSPTFKPQTNDVLTVTSQESTSSPDTDVISIRIPFGWKRIIENNQVVYLSPSSIKLCNKQDVCNYLLLDGTCKCGLECPLLVDKVFNFDVNIVGQVWNVEDLTCSQDLSKLCNHKRKIIAMAKFQHSQAMQTSTDNHGENKVDPSDIESTKPDILSVSDKKLASSFSSTSSTVLNHLPFSTSISDSCTIIPPNIIGHNHKMPKFMDLPPIQMNPFEVATKPRAVRKRKPRVKKSQTPDPAADLGPITCHVPQKLDFSQDSHLNYRFKVDQMNCHMQPSSSPNDYQQGLVSPQGLLSPQGIVSPPNVFSAQSQGMKGPVVFQNPTSNNAMPSGQFMEQIPTSAISSGNLQSQFQLPVNIQTNAGVMFQQMMPVQHNQISPRLGNNEMYNQNNQYQQNVFNNYAYPQMPDMMWMEPGKTKSKRPRGKKDKHKLNSIVDRTSPCPNVDARNTPESSAELSFLENPTAFLAQQTVLVNNSIKSPLSQSKGMKPCMINSTEKRKMYVSPKTTTSSSDLAKPIIGINFKDLNPQISSIQNLKEDSKSPKTTEEKQIFNESTESNCGSPIEAMDDNVSDSHMDEPHSTFIQSAEMRYVNVSSDSKDRAPSVTMTSQNCQTVTNVKENTNLNNLQQIIENTGQNEFPASNLLSAAARAQISQQQTANILGHNTNTMTNTIADNTNIQEWMNKIVLANNGTPNISLDQNAHIMLQQNPHLFAAGSGGLVNSYNGIAGLPLNMFFPLGQAVDPAALSTSNLLLNVNQQIPLLKSDSTNISTTTVQDHSSLKTSLPNVNAQSNLQSSDIINTDQGMTSVNAPMPRLSVPLVSSVTNSISQVIPTVGVTQPLLNNPPLTTLLGGMTFPGMNSLFVANPIAPNQTCNQNLTLMDIVQTGDQTKSASKVSPSSGDNVDIATNIAAAVNQDILSQVQKNDQLGNGVNPQLLFFPNISVPVMQILGSNPYIQQADVDKIALQNTSQYMVPNPMMDQIGQFCTNQQNSTALLQLLGMQQMLNNYPTGVSHLTPAQLQQVQTLQFQQLLLQQLQGMQTLVNQINLQPVSQQGIESELQNQYIKLEEEVEDESQSEADGESQPEPEDLKSENHPTFTITPQNINKDGSKNINRIMNRSNYDDSNHVTDKTQSEELNCVPRKKLKHQIVYHGGSSSDLKNHVDSSVSSDSVVNHVTSGCVKKEQKFGVIYSEKRKHVHHYNGDITINTNKLKRVRNEDVEDAENIKIKQERLSDSFSLGDLVWGEIGGSNWPGKLIHSNNHVITDRIYTNGEEKVLVKWFGDHGESRVNLVQLKSWDEGLIAHKMGGKFNATLEAAIQEALVQESANDLPLIMRQIKK